MLLLFFLGGYPLLIAIVGPDGCGKTSLAEGLASSLNAEFEEVLLFELNFRVLPRFRDIARTLLRRPVGTSHEPGELLAGMRNEPNSALRGGCYMLWYGLDYLLGGWRFRKSIKEGAVIFPRYVYDYGFQRSYSRVPNPLVRLMVSMAPKPDLVFTVQRDANKIFAVKPELSVAEIQRQQEKIKHMLSDQANFHVLDGERGVSATLQQALTVVRGIK